MMGLLTERNTKAHIVLASFMKALEWVHCCALGDYAKMSHISNIAIVLDT